MKNKNTILLVIAGLLLAILLTLLLAPREGGRYGEAPPAPAPPPVAPLRPQAGPVTAPTAVKRPVFKQPAEKRRKLRVSSLGDPGEAMGGGVRLDLPEKTTGQP